MADARHRSRHFLLRWGATTLLTAVGLGLLWWFVADLRERIAYLALLLGSYAGFTLWTYRVAERFAAHDNPARLLQYVMALTFVKMAFGLALVFGYAQWAKPTGIAFLWPFFWTYLTFTTFETYALIRLSFATSPGRRHE